MGQNTPKIGGLEDFIMFGKGKGARAGSSGQKQSKFEVYSDLKAIQRLVDGVPTRFKTLYMRVLTHKAGYAGAVKAKCYECVGFEDATMRVSTCTTYKCPLWAYRPRAKAPDKC